MAFLIPLVCSCFSPPFSPASSSFCSQSIEGGAFCPGVEALSKSLARGVCFEWASLWCSTQWNKASAYEHPSVVDKYLAPELSSGRVAGLFASPPFPLLQVSSFGVISSMDQPGKWRLIVDLCSPGGASVNNGINPDEFTLHYMTVDQVFRMVSQFGQGAVMSKFDVEAAIGTLHFHPSYHFLQNSTSKLPSEHCVSPLILLSPEYEMVQQVLR